MGREETAAGGGRWRAADLLPLVPDEPGWVDLGGLLRSGRCELFAGSDPARGFVARAWDFPFGAVAGEPEEVAVIAATTTGRAGVAAAAGAEWHLLVPGRSRAAVAAALPGWPTRRVVLHCGREEFSALPEPGGEVLLAPHGHAVAGLDLAHLPLELRREYETSYVSRRPLAAALVGGRPVAFCYAPFVTERWWDVAVDTLEGHRRRGLAATCFRALAGHLAERGRQPVWGALGDNEPSLRLAAKLGFTPCAELVSFVAPAADERASAAAGPRE